MNKYGIYPKQFRNARIPIEKNRCFVIMPFRSEYDEVYGEIKCCLNANGFICNRADEIFGSVPIIGKILKEMLRSHFIVADLTGQNPNVFYELGIAHSFKDANNIVLISQNLEDVPFDIRHLSTIIYDKGNYKLLTSRILKTLEENRCYFELFEALQRNSIIGAISDERFDYLQKFQECLGENLKIATAILQGEAGLYSERSVGCVLDVTSSLIYSAASEGNMDDVRGGLKILGALLANCGKSQHALEMANHFLYENKLENYGTQPTEIISLQSQLAVGLAEKRVFQDSTLNWIINYFSKSKSANIDLNRYWLERFLLTTEDEDVNAKIVDSVLHENHYVREHMADFVGEKRLNFGMRTLIAQLGREDNIYTTSSIISALGKLEDDSAYTPIVLWFEKNEDRIKKTKHFFILKHMNIAFRRLGVSNSFTQNFEKKYARHLSPSAIF